MLQNKSFNCTERFAVNWCWWWWKYHIFACDLLSKAFRVQFCPIPCCVTLIEFHRDDTPHDSVCLHIFEIRYLYYWCVCNSLKRSKIRSVCVLFGNAFQSICMMNFNLPNSKRKTNRSYLLSLWQWCSWKKEHRHTRTHKNTIWCIRTRAPKWTHHFDWINNPSPLRHTFAKWIEPFKEPKKKSSFK